MFVLEHKKEQCLKEGINSLFETMKFGSTELIITDAVETSSQTVVCIAATFDVLVWLTQTDLSYLKSCSIFSSNFWESWVFL